jgi:hypothetical protein
VNVIVKSTVGASTNGGILTHNGKNRRKSFHLLDGSIISCTFAFSFHKADCFVIIITFFVGGKYILSTLNSYNNQSALSIK